VLMIRGEYKRDKEQGARNKERHVGLQPTPVGRKRRIAPSSGKEPAGFLEN